MDPRLQHLTLKTAARSVADLAMPRSCVVCRRRLIRDEEHICTGCLADLPLTYFQTLERNPMSERINAVIERGLEAWTPYMRACALFFYNSESPYRRIPQALKYSRRFGDGKFFGRLLGKALAASPLYADVDLVVPVPLHWTRKLQRGYNQAEILGEQVAGELEGARLDARVLRRSRRTRTQTRLSVEGKSRNVRDAFRVVGKPACRHILLVDDVCTTGATLAACHRALRSAFGEEVRISAATLAYVTTS